jgi:hypothetical protein
MSLCVFYVGFIWLEISRTLEGNTLFDEMR